MSKDLGEPLGFLEKIPPRDKEIILLAPIYFYGKYMRRKVNVEGFRQPDWDENDFTSWLSAAHNLFDQANTDIEGDVVGAISKALTEHPMRDKLFPNLKDKDILLACQKLEDIFYNEEFVDWVEGSSSYYDVDGPNEFAIDTANSILYVYGPDIGMDWFRKIDSFDDRKLIIKAVLSEKASGNIAGLLSSGEISE